MTLPTNENELGVHNPLLPLIERGVTLPAEPIILGVHSPLLPLIEVGVTLPAEPIVLEVHSPLLPLIEGDLKRTGEDEELRLFSDDIVLLLLRQLVIMGVDVSLAPPLSTAAKGDIKKLAELTVPNLLCDSIVFSLNKGGCGFTLLNSAIG